MGTSGRGILRGPGFFDGELRRGALGVTIQFQQRQQGIDVKAGFGIAVVGGDFMLDCHRFLHTGEIDKSAQRSDKFMASCFPSGRRMSGRSKRIGRGISTASIAIKCIAQIPMPIAIAPPHSARVTALDSGPRPCYTSSHSSITIR